LLDNPKTIERPDFCPSLFLNGKRKEDLDDSKIRH